MLASARAAIRSLSPHSSPIVSAPTFPPLPSSPSRAPLLNIPSISATANHEDSSTTFLVTGLPVTRVGSSNRPKITTQMNDTWMRDYEDHTKEVQKRKGRGQIDLEMVEKFRVVWWEKARFILLPHCNLLMTQNIRLRTTQRFLPFENARSGQNGRFKIHHLHSNDLVTTSSNSTTPTTTSGLKVTPPTPTRFRPMATSFFGVLGLSARILTDILRQLSTNQPTNAPT